MKIKVLNAKNSPFFWLKLAAACTFAGRAYQHLFWDAPYRELLWDDKLMRPVVEALTPWDWHQFVTNLAVDESIREFMVGIGFFYGVCAAFCLFYEEKWRKWFRWPLLLGTLGLVVLALLYMKEHFLSLGQFFEYTLQFCAPVFLLAFGKNGGITPRLALAMKLAIALTFACHGLYALGYYPRPGIFTTMTMQTFDCSEAFAVQFLRVAGWLDFAVAIGVFLPSQASRWALLYAAGWGVLTSAARVTGNFYADFPMQSLHEWLYQTVYRLPHGFVPLALWLASQKVVEK